MKHTSRRVTFVAAAVVVLASSAYAQRRGQVRRPSAVAAPVQSQVITIPVVEVANMMQRQRVFLVTPPAGATSYGLSSLGSEGYRVWALLPSCRQPNPDDPRDPCPVGRVTMQAINGGGEIRAAEPQTVTESPESRRVQSFVVPSSVSQVRIRILRRDDTVRYEAGVDASQLTQLPTAQGNAGGARGFNFDLPQYPAL